MRVVTGIGIIILVVVLAAFLGHNMDSDAVVLTVGVLFGILAGIPTAMMVAHQRTPTETIQHHHTHDVAVRIIPSNIQRAMAQYGADDAVRINGQWLLLDGDQVVSSQRLLAG